MCEEDGPDMTYCLDTCSAYEAELPDTDSFKYRNYLVRRDEMLYYIFCSLLSRTYCVIVPYSFLFVCFFVFLCFHPIGLNLQFTHIFI